MDEEVSIYYANGFYLLLDRSTGDAEEPVFCTCENCLTSLKLTQLSTHV